MKSPRDQIRRRRNVRWTAPPPPAATRTGQAMLTHQSGGTLATKPMPPPVQLIVDAWSAVGALRRRMDLFDPRHQLGMGLRLRLPSGLGPQSDDRGDRFGVVDVEVEHLSVRLEDADRVVVGAQLLEAVLRLEHVGAVEAQRGDALMDLDRWERPFDVFRRRGRRRSGRVVCPRQGRSRGRRARWRPLWE